MKHQEKHQQHFDLVKVLLDTQCCIHTADQLGRKGKRWVILYTHTHTHLHCLPTTKQMSEELRSCEKLNSNPCVTVDISLNIEPTSVHTTQVTWQTICKHTHKQTHNIIPCCWKGQSSCFEKSLHPLSAKVNMEYKTMWLISFLPHKLNEPCKNVSEPETGLLYRLCSSLPSLNYSEL